MYCHICGREMKDDARYCPACGTPVSADVPAEASFFEASTPGSSGLAGAAEASRGRSRRKLPPLVIIALTLALAAGTALAAYFVYTNAVQGPEERPSNAAIEATYDDGGQLANDRYSNEFVEIQFPAGYLNQNVELSVKSHSGGAWNTVMSYRLESGALLQLFSIAGVHSPAEGTPIEYRASGDVTSGWSIGSTQWDAQVLANITPYFSGPQWEVRAGAAIGALRLADIPGALWVYENGAESETQALATTNWLAGFEVSEDDERALLYLATGGSITLDELLSMTEAEMREAGTNAARSFFDDTIAPNIRYLAYSEADSISAERHVTSNEYEFDLPDYWMGKVTVENEADSTVIRGDESGLARPSFAGVMRVEASSNQGALSQHYCGASLAVSNGRVVNVSYPNTSWDRFGFYSSQMYANTTGEQAPSLEEVLRAPSSAQLLLSTGGVLDDETVKSIADLDELTIYTGQFFAEEVLPFLIVKGGAWEDEPPAAAEETAAPAEADGDVVGGTVRLGSWGEWARSVGASDETVEELAAMGDYAYLDLDSVYVFSAVYGNAGMVERKAATLKFVYVDEWRHLADRHITIQISEVSIPTDISAADTDGVIMQCSLLSTS